MTMPDDRSALRRGATLMIALAALGLSAGCGVSPAPVPAAVIIPSTVASAAPSAPGASTAAVASTAVVASKHKAAGKKPSVALGFGSTATPAPAPAKHVKVAAPTTDAGVTVTPMPADSALPTEPTPPPTILPAPTTKQPTLPPAPTSTPAPTKAAPTTPAASHTLSGSVSVGIGDKLSGAANGVVSGDPDTSYAQMTQGQLNQLGVLLDALGKGQTFACPLGGGGSVADIVPGAQVTIANASGTVIATAALTGGTLSMHGCSFSFSADHLPDESFYRVTVTNRGAISYSEADLVSRGWTIATSIS